MVLLSSSVFVTMILVACAGPSLSAIRGPLYAAELEKCLPADMYALVQETVDGMASMTPEQPPGSGMPVDKMAWFAQILTKHMTGGRPFCHAFAMTTSLATSRFSDHLLRGAPLAEYRRTCHARLSGSSNPYARFIGTTPRPGPMTVANDPLLNCLMTGSFAVEQTRLDEPDHPVR